MLEAYANSNREPLVESVSPDLSAGMWKEPRMNPKSWGFQNSSYFLKNSWPDNFSVLDTSDSGSDARSVSSNCVFAF